jgi:hypothetical protein
MSRKYLPDDRGRQKPPPVFTLQLTALPNVDAIRALRAALKVLLRRFGLRCTSVSVEHDEAPP